MCKGERMKRILIGYISNTKGSGLDNYIYNLVDILKTEAVQIDLLSSAIDKELEEKYKANPNIRFLPIDRIPHPKKRYDQIRKYAKENKYDIAYFNISEAFDCFGNLACHQIVPVVITHSHSAGNDNQNRLKRYVSKVAHICGRPVINKYTTYCFACSDLAANWLFGKGKKYRLIRNTIQSKRFLYNSMNRKEVREQLGISEETVVLGFVGNLTYSKNPFFLLQFMKELRKKIPNSYLLIIGDGPLRNSLEQTASKNKQNYILFLGKRFDIERYYSAMDLFVLPSNFEGYGIVGVEAQVNGLPCLFSDKVPKALAFSNHSLFFHTQNMEEGVEKAQKLLQLGRMDPKEYPSEILYDLNDQKQEFIDIFIHGKFEK